MANPKGTGQKFPLPYGCRPVCRPARKEARRVTPKAIARFIRAALDAGEDEAAVCAAIESEIDCGITEEECSRYRILVEAAAAAIALSLAMVVSRRQAAKLAQQAIDEAIAAAKTSELLGKIERKIMVDRLLQIRQIMALNDTAEKQMEDALQETLDSIKASVQDTGVTITTTGE